jgi:hypothetical protein
LDFTVPKTAASLGYPHTLAYHPLRRCAKYGGIRNAKCASIWLDRLGRSLTHLAIIVGELQMRNVALICTSQGIDTSKQNHVGQPAIDFIGFKSTVMVKKTGQRVVSAGAKSCRK